MSRRNEKIARVLQVNLAELINYRLSDPRVELMVNVTRVDVAPDGSRARVWVTAINATDTQMKLLVEALSHAAVRLRTMLNDRVEMRHIPHLDFRGDEQARKAQETLRLIGQAMREQEPPAAPGAEDTTPENPKP